MKHEMEQKKNAELTDFPKLFGRCYWGNSPARSSEETKEIVQNRNDFARRFRLREFVDSVPPQLTLGLFDHCELYRCEKGYVYVTSPDGCYDELADRFGLDRTVALYERSCSTYVRFFARKVEFNRFLKNSSRLTVRRDGGIVDFRKTSVID
jgi:hypothetical protein